MKNSAAHEVHSLVSISTTSWTKKAVIFSAIEDMLSVREVTSRAVKLPSAFATFVNESFINFIPRCHIYIVDWLHRVAGTVPFNVFFCCFNIRRKASTTCGSH